MSVAVVILAAGKGTRMKSDLAKVLHEAAGRSLLDWVLAAVAPVGASETVVVVGHQADAVTATLPPGVRSVVQQPQRGTADAAAKGLAGLGPEPDTVLVLPGDMPLLTSDILSDLVETHVGAGAAATMLTATMVDPAGYGRVLTDDRGRVVGIVEEADADDTEREITSVNTSVYAFDRSLLAATLDRVTPENRQEEFYLTDVVGLLAADGHEVMGVATTEVEAAGVNSHAQLAAVASTLRQRINAHWLAEGVWMLDPSRVYLEPSVRLAPGVRLYPDVYLEGDTKVEAGAEIGPSVHARDVSVGADARVRYSVLAGAAIGPATSVGPYAYLRPGARLADGAKAGTFVEIKNSSVGKDSKVPHLSYVGDADIGEGSNLGAGTVTVNYDGYEKHRTTVGDRVRIGSDTMLVAPVVVGDDAFTGAGSVITKDVADGALAVERSPQREVPGYAERRRRKAEEKAD